MPRFPGYANRHIANLIERLESQERAYRNLRLIVVVAATLIVVLSAALLVAVAAA
jgi:CHASE3 domain sensor protein